MTMLLFLAKTRVSANRTFHYGRMPARFGWKHVFVDRPDVSFVFGLSPGGDRCYLNESKSRSMRLFSQEAWHDKTDIQADDLAALHSGCDGGLQRKT
jgi:hypothetical protein